MYSLQMAFYKSFGEWKLVFATEKKIFPWPMLTLSAPSDEEKMEKLLFIKVRDPVNNRTRSVRCDKAIPFCGRADIDVEVPPEVERYFAGEVPEDLTPLVEWFVSSFYTNYVEVAGIPSTGNESSDRKIEKIYEIYILQLLGERLNLRKEAFSFFHVEGFKIPRELFGTIFEGVVFTLIMEMADYEKVMVIEYNSETLSEDDIALILRGVKVIRNLDFLGIDKIFHILRERDEETFKRFVKVYWFDLECLPEYAELIVHTLSDPEKTKDLSNKAVEMFKQLSHSTPERINKFLMAILESSLPEKCKRHILYILSAHARSGWQMSGMHTLFTKESIDALLVFDSDGAGDGLREYRERM